MKCVKWKTLVFSFWKINNKKRGGKCIWKFIDELFSLYHSFHMFTMFKHRILPERIVWLSAWWSRGNVIMLEDFYRNKISGNTLSCSLRFSGSLKMYSEKKKDPRKIPPTYLVPYLDDFWGNVHILLGLLVGIFDIHRCIEITRCLQCDTSNQSDVLKSYGLYDISKYSHYRINDHQLISLFDL